MENRLGVGTINGDPLGRGREIRVPVDGVRALGLPDVPAESLPLGPGNDKSGKGKGAQAKAGQGSSDQGKSGSGNTDIAGEKLGWFDVMVVDAWGSPVGGIELEISYQGTRKKLRTPPNGTVRVEGVDSSFGTVRFVDVPAARELLRPRWVRKPPETPPDVENPTEIALADDLGGVSVTSETPMTIVLVKALTRVRLVGMHFDTNKSFMRKTAIPGIRRVVREYAELGSGSLLVVGHTDTVAEEHYNLDLSLERAEAVKAYVRNDVPGWEKWFADTIYPDKKRWGDLEIHHMISALPCDASVEGFQAWSNENRGTALKIDGKSGEKTRHELINAYMELEETTLPTNIGVEVHGCGEYFPATKDKSDNVESEENRRVELFCFDDEIHPPLPGKRAKKNEPEYPQWKKQVTETVDVEAPAIEIISIRLCEPNRTPIPNAVCRDVSSPGVVRTADQAGWIQFPVSRGGFVTIEWDFPAFPVRFSFRQTIHHIVAKSSDEAAAERRLRHLGFLGDELHDLVRSYQETLGREGTGKLTDIKDELFAWHDGGPPPPPSTPA